jgi:hypothetical protein
VNIAPENEGMCVGGGADEGDHGDHGDGGHGDADHGSAVISAEAIVAAAHEAGTSRAGCYRPSAGHTTDCLFAGEATEAECTGDDTWLPESGSCTDRLATAACYDTGKAPDCAFDTGITKAACDARGGAWWMEYNENNNPLVDSNDDIFWSNTCGSKMEAAMAGGDGRSSRAAIVEVEDHMTGAHKGGCYESGTNMDCVFAEEFTSFGDDAYKKEMCEAMGAGTHSWYPESSSCEKRMDAAGCYTGQSDITDADGNVIHPAHTVYCVYARYYGKDHPDQLAANNVVADAAGSSRHAAPLDTKAKCDAVGGSWYYESTSCKARLEEHDASVSGCYSGMVPENQADYHKMTCKKEGPHTSKATCPTGPGGAGWYEETTSCGAADPDKLAAYECVEGAGCYNRLGHGCECPTGANAVFIDGAPIGSLRDDGSSTCDDAAGKSDGTPPPGMTNGCGCQCFCGTADTGPCGA